MPKSSDERIFLPNEILKKIFIHLKFQTVIQLNKGWRDYFENNCHYFKEIYIDLSTVKIDFLKKINPIKIYLTCSRFHKKLFNNSIYIIELLKYKIDIIIKYLFLKKLIVKLDLVYILDDISKIINNLVQKNLSIKSKYNTLSTFIIFNLLTINVEYFYLKINSDNYKKIKKKKFNSIYKFIKIVID